MLSYVKGDLLSSPAQVQVNTVNTVGIMGKGIALQFKDKYPSMYDAYRDACEAKELNIGNLFLWKSNKKWVLMFPTKKHWRENSKKEYIEEGLIKFVENYEQIGINSIAFPKLGCGNGNLHWSEVKPIMEKYLKPLPITIYIYLDNYKKDTRRAKKKADIALPLLEPEIQTMTFEALKHRLKRAFLQDNSIVYSDGSVKSAKWENDKIIIQNGHTIELKEEELCSFWEYIKNVGVIAEKKIPEEYSKYADIMLSIFRKMEYLEPVLIAKSESELSSGKGYQYIGG